MTLWILQYNGVPDILNKFRCCCSYSQSRTKKQIDCIIDILFEILSWVPFYIRQFCYVVYSIQRKFPPKYRLSPYNLLSVDMLHAGIGPATQNAAANLSTAFLSCENLAPPGGGGGLSQSRLTKTAGCPPQPYAWGTRESFKNIVRPYILKELLTTSSS